MAAKYQQRLAASSGISSSKAFESDIGKRILKKYGWEEGQGLGKLRNGTTDCLQATRREQKVGLGAEKRKAEDKWENWWADCYNSVASKVAVQTPARVHDADSDDSSDEGAAPTLPRETCIKQASAMRGKLRRVLRQEAA
eukprot:TRINITY_DN445_c0_g1_i1.p1 TRINITY_DN445_c0_g1~~TRINITY_DN445_c0_g1_i1.p1  ORF type:complete len:140 (+),score=53.42 TRINITY_DN445_c0_g1_i1:115-534(+)